MVVGGHHQDTLAQRLGPGVGGYLRARYLLPARPYGGQFHGSFGAQRPGRVA